MNQMFDFFLRSRNRRRGINRDTHAVLDYLTVGAFAFMAGFFWNSKKRAATTAIVNGSAVLGASLFTDYNGSLRRVIPFETHGKIDIAQMAMAATMPILLGFANEAAAVPFLLQAMNEAVVVLSTDWYSAGGTVAALPDGPNQTLSRIA
ncbi:MAG: hypothetical protein NVS9B15_22530 [Acidobacteriaceae bacterium]